MADIERSFAASWSAAAAYASALSLRAQPHEEPTYAGLVAHFKRPDVSASHSSASWARTISSAATRTNKCRRSCCQRFARTPARTACNKLRRAIERRAPGPHAVASAGGRYVCERRSEELLRRLKEECNSGRRERERRARLADRGSASRCGPSQTRLRQRHDGTAEIATAAVLPPPMPPAATASAAAAADKDAATARYRP